MPSPQGKKHTFQYLLFQNDTICYECPICIFQKTFKKFMTCVESDALLTRHDVPLKKV